MAATAVPTTRPAAGSLAPLLKDGLIAGAIAFVLLLPLLGMRTTSGSGGLTLEFQLGQVVLATALVILGRVLVGLYVRSGIGAPLSRAAGAVGGALGS